jgi:preprotein translocase subunit SecD
MTNIKYRVALIVALTLTSVWALWPRTVKERWRNPQTGASEYREVKRVPLKLGLDLEGGIHLALEVDESKGAIADKADALNRAETVVRNRIDQFGVAEPVVQRVGDGRLIIELPGIDDPERA